MVRAHPRPVLRGLPQDARYVVFFMIGVFSMAALSVVTSLGTYPLVRYFAPDLDQKPCTLPLLGTSSVAWVMGFVVSVALVVTWVVGRHNPYAWILQDTFGVFVCCQFMLALRMNSIKVLSGLQGRVLSCVVPPVVRSPGKS